jgi:putative transposase
MRKSRFTESQIIVILAQQEQGMKVSQICREHGISIPTFHNWKSKYSGMNVNQLKKLKELEADHSRLKKMYAELSLVHHAFKDAIEKKL